MRMHYRALGGRPDHQSDITCCSRANAASIEHEPHCTFKQVRSCSELQEIVRQLPVGYAAYMVGGQDTYTGQNMGLITRIDPVVDLWRTDERAHVPLPESTCGRTGRATTQGI
jgi:hypothetical protein